MSLVNITPQVDWSLDCENDMCDGYGCEVHDDWAEWGCSVDDCDSEFSTYLVLLNGVESELCQYHYATIKDSLKSV
jgi:hypothetical protein